MKARVMSLLDIASDRLAKVCWNVLRLLKSRVVLVEGGMRLKLLHLLSVVEVSVLLGTIRCTIGRMGAVRSKLRCLLVSMDRLLWGRITLKVVLRKWTVMCVHITWCYHGRLVHVRFVRT